MGFTVLFVIFCLVFGVFWSFESLLCLLLALFICVLYDMYNIIKRIFYICYYKITRRFSPKKLMDANGFKVMCLPTDVDMNLHLTESRLLQECTFAHTKFWTENFMYDALYSRQAAIHVAGRYIRYKYPIKLFESFEIISHVISWDETAFYVSQ
ncbi:protein THEM6-like [Mercenaria mercenaria]|uniref:protein THEM6-like n=1 Tax=Mercenaria mercenaria TaxID=6596 RepID=UPI00234EFA19|nr:protein THEM6-like [Mercenaria mercenaria]